jgi:hypothetical protein
MKRRFRTCKTERAIPENFSLFLPLEVRVNDHARFRPVGARWMKYNANFLSCRVTGVHYPSLRRFQEIGMVFTVDKSACARLGARQNRATRPRYPSGAPLRYKAMRELDEVG